MTDMRGSMPPPADPSSELTCDEVRDLAASFVLDALPGPEAGAVRAHLATCADPHPEMLELAGALPVLMESVPIVEPPAGLKARIMAAAAADLEARAATEAPAVTPVEATVHTAAPLAFPTGAERQVRSEARNETRRMRAGPSLGTWALRIAAVLAIAALGGWNLLLQGQLGVARSYEQNVAAVLDVAAQDGALAAVLTPAEGSTASGLAAVSADGQVRIAMRALAATQGEQVYETWVIGSDGVPVAVGGFRVAADGTGFFEGGGVPVQPGIVLALTLEPGPGATVPTTPPVSVGTVGAAG